MTLAWLFASPPASDDDERPSLARQDAVPAHVTPEVSDQILVQRIRAGDSAALETVFLTYHARLCTFASTYVPSRSGAEDVVSDVFLRVWAARASFAPAGSIEAYLFRAVRNRAADYVRDERRLAARHEAAMAAQLASSTGDASILPDGVTDPDPEIAELWQAIAEMPPQRRAIMILRWQQGKSFAEIAEAMGMSRPAVQMQVGRALKALRQLLVGGRKSDATSDPSP